METDFLKHAVKRLNDYGKRGYPEEVLLQAFDRAYDTDRQALLNPDKTKKDRDTRVKLVMTYNPANPKVMSTIKKHWPMLQLSKTCRNSFKELPIVAYRRPKNLTDHLVRAKVRQPTGAPAQQSSQVPARRQCTRIICEICPSRTNPPKFYRSSYTGRTYDSPTNYNCETTNVVYLITCNRCKKQYVGETSRSFRKRMLEHKNYVRRKDMSTATGRHFNMPGHKSSDLNYQVIATLTGPSLPKCPKRLKLEERLIERLRTMEPHGLNDKNSLRV